MTEFKIRDGVIRKAKGDSGTAVYDHVVSVFGNKDYAGDVVKPGAFAKTIDDFKQAGQPLGAFYTHRTDDPAMYMGKITDVAEVLPGDPRLVGMGGAAEKNGGLLARIEYDTSNPNTARVVKMIDDGVLKQSSFMYEVEDGGFVSAKDAEASGHADLGDHYELRQLKLLEAGPCYLGMNDQTTVLTGKTKDRQAAMRDAAGKGALPLSVGPAKCVEGAWDGPGTEAKISSSASASQIAAFYAWRDPDKDAATKAAYSFIHHTMGDDGHAAAANLKACQTGIGVLNGARGGTVIPAGDVKGVYAHLAAHIKEAGQEPPELDEKSWKDVTAPRELPLPAATRTCSCGAQDVAAESLFCPQCGAELPAPAYEPGAEADSSKGRKAADYEPQPYHRDPDENVQCLHCQKYNDVDAHFCDQCGHVLTGAGNALVADGKARGKAGRALNGKNEADLRQAVALVQGVLSSVDSGDDGGTDDGKSGRPAGATGKSSESTSVNAAEAEKQARERALILLDLEN